MLFTVPSASAILRDPYSSLILKILTKIHESRKLESIHEYHIRVENQTKSEEIRVYAQKTG
jgi:hypothetical protein